MTDVISQTLRDRVAELSPMQKRLLHERLCASGVEASSRGGRLVSFYQSHRELEADELRQLCSKQLPAHMVPQRFIHAEKLALTPTGKLNRHAMRVQLWTSAGSSTSNAQEVTAARNPVEEILSEIWSDVLGIDEISVFDNFFEIGGDSLQIIRILSRASKAGLVIKPDAILSHPTIAELARLAGADDQGADSASAPEVIDDHGDLPLLPIQRWFFDVIDKSHHHWNQSYLFALSGESNVTVSQVERAATRLLEEHAGLRTCFFDEDGEWFAQIIETMDPDVASVAIDGQTREECVTTMTRAANACNASMSLADGPLFRVICFTDRERVRYLSVIAHHLIVDAVSWQLIVADLERLLPGSDHSSASAPANTTSLKQWSLALEALAERSELAASRHYWQEQAARASVELPRDMADARSDQNTEGSCVWVSRSLDAARTDRLRSERPRELRCSVQELLLSGLVSVLSRWMQSSTVTLDLEGHGREAVVDGLDVTSTVGWCTTVFPVNVDLVANSIEDPANVLRQVKEQLRAVPENGLSHGVFRYGTHAPTDLTEAARSKVLFNYLGITQSSGDSGLLALEDARFGVARDPSSRRAYELELNAVVSQGQLTIDWAYSPLLHAGATIERLADELMAQLRQLIDGEASPGISVSPTDFPMSGLDQSALDNLSSQLDDLDDE